MRALQQLTLTSLLLIGLIGISYQKEKLSDNKDVCRNFVDGTKLRKPGTCNTQVTCQNHKSIETLVCTDPTPYYNRETKKCIAKASDSYCSAPCSKLSPKYVNDKKNCNGWYECNGSKEVTHGLCPENMFFNQKSQMCLYPDEPSCDVTYDFCDIVPSKALFQDELNCNKYYQCNSRGQLVSQTCNDGEYFHPDQAKCVAKSLVTCKQHPYPENVCGTSKIALRNRFVSDGATCRGYFYCKDLGVGKPDPSPKWGQCPIGEFFDARLEACAQRSQTSCKDDRCDGRMSGRELSTRSGCQHYLECQNSHTLSEQYCGDGLFFDAATEQCTLVRQTYAICI